VAYAISMLGSTPVITPVAMSCVAWAFAGLRAWRLASLYALLAVMLPMGYVVWLLRRGLVTDIDVQVREQRTRPMIATLACALVAWLALWAANAPRQLVVLALASWLQTGLLFLITLRWKISVHCAAAATSVTVIGSLVGSPLPLLIGAPIMAWSRVRLRRHTLAQTMAGTALGVVVSVIALFLLRV
jgi:membrane-associated phospholipid phosphatase